MSRSPWRRWLPESATEAAVVVGRGCPYSCTYCSNHALARVAEGKYVRFRSAGNIIAEITQILADAPHTRSIFLEAETLSANLPFTFGLLEALRTFNEGLPRPLELSTNITLTKHVLGNRALLEAFRRAGFRCLFIGLETGSARLRGEVLKRPRYTNEEFIAFAKLAREHGIGLNVYVIVGLPTETRAEFEETVAVLREAQPAEICLSMFFPYPGTDISKLAEELLPGGLDLEARERREPIIELAGFAKWQIRLQYIVIDWRVFRGQLPLGRLLRATRTRITDVYPSTRPLVGLVDRVLKASRAALRRDCR
jgi:radical SAM superfamily enzyme YgiQ (UPF0313 family)